MNLDSESSNDAIITSVIESFEGSQKITDIPGCLTYFGLMKQTTLVFDKFGDGREPNDAHYRVMSQIILDVYLERLFDALLLSITIVIS